MSMNPNAASRKASAVLILLTDPAKVRAPRQTVKSSVVCQITPLHTDVDSIQVHLSIEQWMEAASI